LKSLPKATLAALALFLICEPALADDVSKVLVVLDSEEDTTVVRRICRELGALGLEAETVEAVADYTAHHSLEELARSNGALAVIKIELGSGALEVWVADLVTGKEVYRSVEVMAGSEPAASVIAVEAVELLRASLMELHSARPPKGEVEPTPAITEFSEPPAPPPPPSPPPRPKILFIDLGPTLSFPNTDSGPSMGLTASFYGRLAKRLRLGVYGLGPLVASSRTVPEGEIKVAPALVAAELLVALNKIDARVVPELGAGFGAAFFMVRGMAKTGFVSGDFTLVSAFPYVKTKLSIRLTRILALRADIAVGWTTVANTVQVAQRNVVDLGRPWIIASVGLAIAIW
jgi:hypothetical protein